MVVVYKISDNTKEKMIEYYEDKKREKTPPYAVFQAEEAGTIITLYESGKVMFQGISADIDANMWRDMEAHLNNGKMPEEKKKKEKEKTDAYVRLVRTVKENTEQENAYQKSRVG